MAMSVTYEVPVDTSMCSPQQVHPWSLMTLSMNGWARWLRACLVPFRALVREHGTGVVIVGYDLEYLEPFTFFDADAFDITVTTRVRDDGGLLCFDLDYVSPKGRWARARVVGRIVRISDEGSLAARPGVLPAALLDRFGAEDRFSGSVPRVLDQHTRDVEWSSELSSDLRVHRGHCEAADQWSFTELPRVVAEVRESWALGAGDDPRASSGLGAPVRRLVAELTYPLFIFDAATVSTGVDTAGLRYLHRIHGASRVHATVYEELRQPSGAA